MIFTNHINWFAGFLPSFPSTVGDFICNLIHVQSAKDTVALFDSQGTITSPTPKMPPAERLSTTTLKAGFSLTVPKRKTSAVWCVMPRGKRKIAAKNLVDKDVEVVSGSFCSTEKWVCTTKFHIIKILYRESLLL